MPRINDLLVLDQPLPSLPLPGFHLYLVFPPGKEKQLGCPFKTHPTPSSPSHRWAPGKGVAHSEFIKLIVPLPALPCRSSLLEKLASLCL